MAANTLLERQAKAVAERQDIEALIPEPKVARILGITTRTLYGLRQAKRIAFIQHSEGGRIFYRPDDVRQYLAAVQSPAKLKNRRRPGKTLSAAF